jgi:hypothetical protein
MIPAAPRISAPSSPRVLLPPHESCSCPTSPRPRRESCPRPRPLPRREASPRGLSPATRPKANDPDISTLPYATRDSPTAPPPFPSGLTPPAAGFPARARRRFPARARLRFPARARLQVPPYSRHPYIRAACQIPRPNWDRETDECDSLLHLSVRESHSSVFGYEAVWRLVLEGRYITRGMLSTRLDPDLVAIPDVRCASFPCVAALSRDRNPAWNGQRGDLHRCLAQVLFTRFGGLAGRTGEILPVR